ncbi:MAG: hypothetical protein C0594_04305 [Marinilabiliales bacterium]|nr:MAG: hypothetical protein C0594_04305 [Marinilabiliales bacterium]
MKKVFILITVLIFLGNFADAQRWKRTRYEVLFGVALTNLQGDLGGANSDEIYMIDYDLFATRAALDLGLRYKATESVALKLNIIPGLFNGSDKYTTASGRAGRQNTTSTFLLETSVQGEISLIKERLSTRYTFRNMRDFRLKYVNTYLIFGVGGYYYNAKRTSEVYGNASYSGYKLSIPLGIGFKYGINRRFSLNLEYGARKTFDDYIDAYASSVAGNKNKDLYMFLRINISYKLRTSRSGLPRF